MRSIDGEVFQEISKKHLTTPHVCGKIIMLFLRQQVLESSVRLCRLPRNVRKVALCLFLGLCAGKRLFSLLTSFRYKFLKRGETECPVQRFFLRSRLTSLI